MEKELLLKVQGESSGDVAFFANAKGKDGFSTNKEKKMMKGKKKFQGEERPCHCRVTYKESK